MNKGLNRAFKSRLQFAGAVMNKQQFEVVKVHQRLKLFLGVF